MLTAGAALSVDCSLTKRFLALGHPRASIVDATLLLPSFALVCVIHITEEAYDQATAE
ncbi:hypothetical protein BRCON_1936 [Candidatus Sumerlaea chitinivorans]|uniref:Uncharacterized protein n=1 Tax=Sumerlaea chitinivorans TaxID=2250252 RepID=A0A2Z4Y8F3_SUMC1|nr:hypothetical protein BRCON_1936 [Candidatus Sumerlaea chitinivorans]